jgi:hypothetical protein
MKVNLKLDQFSQQLTAVAQQAYPESGALKSSIKVEVTEDDIVISFKTTVCFRTPEFKEHLELRIHLAEGTAKRSLDTKQRRDKFGRPAPVGGNLNWGARVNIRKFGIPAKPWIARMITSHQRPDS